MRLTLSLIAGALAFTVDGVFAHVWRGLAGGCPERVPGERGSTFYNLAAVDPGVLAVDESTKETVTGTELGGLTTAGSVAMSNLVNVPVLSVVGEKDTLFCLALPCGALLNALMLEPLAYPPAAQLETVVVPDSGHNLNLQICAPQAYAAIIEWLDRRFPAAF